MTVSVRQAQNSDKDAILAISAQIWGGSDYVPMVLDKWMKADTGILWVAEDDGLIAGFSRMTFLNNNRCWMEGIRVDPAQRGKGIGKALTQFQLEEAHRRGYGCCALSSYVENYESLHIIRKNGFIEIADFKFYEYAVPSSEEQDELWEQEQHRAAMERQAHLENCHISHLGSEDWLLIETYLKESNVLSDRNGYMSYDWTFEWATEPFLKQRLAAGDFYLLEKQGESTILSISKLHAKGNYHTLNYVSNLTLEAEAVAFALEHMCQTGETACSYMAKDNKDIDVLKRLGFNVFNDETVDTFVFERKEQEA